MKQFKLIIPTVCFLIIGLLIIMIIQNRIINVDEKQTYFTNKDVSTSSVSDIVKDSKCAVYIAKAAIKSVYNDLHYYMVHTVFT